MLIHGDLFDVLPTLAAESFDSCVTDPPYDLTTIGRAFQGSGGTMRPDGGARSERRTGGFMGKEWDGTGVAFNVETWRAVYRVLKPGAHLVAFGGTRTSHRMVCAIEDAGFEIRDSLVWLYGQGFPKSRNLGDGWGTALKPGHEPIALARKPFTGTITANHQQRGVGGLNVDGCRIEALGEAGARREHHGKVYDGVAEGYQRPGTSSYTHKTDWAMPEDGRWPANVLLDPDAAALLDAQSGDSVSRIGAPRGSALPGDGWGMTRTGAEYDDNGGASRFFYVAKPSREERDLGCERLDARQRDESRKDGNPGGDNPRNRGLQRRGNFHPTVKPLALMRWLVRLVTPEGGIVLEPFGGSGTTAMACAAEGLECTLIEREAEYLPIIEARVRAIAPLFIKPTRTWETSRHLQQRIDDDC